MRRNEGLTPDVVQDMEQGISRAGHTEHHAHHAERAEQLRLLEVAPAALVEEAGPEHRPDWLLDARTRRLGKEGVAKAREALRRAHPPTPSRQNAA